MLGYKQSVYEQTTEILTIIISKIKRLSIHAFSHYSAFSTIPTPFYIRAVNILFQFIYHLCRITVPNNVKLRRKHQ